MQVTRVFAPQTFSCYSNIFIITFVIFSISALIFCVFNIPQCTADGGAFVSVSWFGISNNICSFAHKWYSDAGGTIRRQLLVLSVQRTSL